MSGIEKNFFLVWLYLWIFIILEFKSGSFLRYLLTYLCKVTAFTEVL